MTFLCLETAEIRGQHKAITPARHLTLVSCCGPKAGAILPARELYRSPLFRKSATWAERQGHDWFVLSAAHGMIRPDDRIAPYDQSLQKMSPADRELWARKVAQQLVAWTSYWDAPRLHITLLAGAAYANWIARVQSWCTIEQPLQGKQIGQRLQWLTDELSRSSIIRPPATQRLPFDTPELAKAHA